MALYGTSRDVSLFRHINRELLHDIISQQCVFYQLQAAETKVNIYGESSGAKYYEEPVILNMLLNLGDITFKFLKDDLVDANVLPKIGDIVMWYEGYWELDNVSDNELFVGKDPDYPYSPNPLNPGLENFGYNISLTCTAHYVPADKVGITKERI